ncbi:DUF4145 domain-containing protein [Arthrobacter sp. ok362]|uniref:DUF4145 domain-containing protein n=1 Tax=Arthrobacter sp. ok362 TaxID=1761745 RepID=UPI0015881430|nr:DUF4145 domain-containing protein [Arthrobacter sp. ok362]
MDESGQETVQSAFACAACGLISLGATDLIPGMPAYGSKVSESMAEHFWGQVGVDRWLPGNTGPMIQNLPPAVEIASADAYRSYKAGIYTAAVLMARTTIEATAKDHKITGGNLVEKIKKMLEEGLILESTKRAADAIRHLGNDMAHGDLSVSVGQDMARDVVELMQLILREVYELPYLAERLQKRADERSVAAVQAAASSVES